MPHANRSKRNRSAASNPTPAELCAAREAAKHTPVLAARTIYSTVTMWEECETEGSPRKMHPGLYELYLLKTGRKTVEQVLDEAAQRALQEPYDHE